METPGMRETTRHARNEATAGARARVTDGPASRTRGSKATAVSRATESANKKTVTAPKVTVEPTLATGMPRQSVQLERTENKDRVKVKDKVTETALVLVLALLSEPEPELPLEPALTSSCSRFLGKLPVVPEGFKSFLARTTTLPPQLANSRSSHLFLRPSPRSQSEQAPPHRLAFSPALLRLVSLLPAVPSPPQELCNPSLGRTTPGLLSPPDKPPLELL